MILSFLFSLTAFLALFCIQFIPGFQMSGSGDMLLFSLLLMLFTPAVLYIISPLQEDLKEDKYCSPFSIFAFIGYWIALLLFIFLLFRGFSIWVSLGWLFVFVCLFFLIESRLFYVGAFWNLIVVICALCFWLNEIANTASIYLYYWLVLWIISEITTPFLMSVHKKSKRIFQISFPKNHAFQIVLENIKLIIVLLTLFFLLSFWLQAIGIYSNYSILPVYIYIFWIILASYFLISKKRYHFTELLSNDFNWHCKLFSSPFVLYSFNSLFVALLVDISFFIQLDFLIQFILIFSCTVLVFLLQKILFYLLDKNKAKNLM